MSLFLQKNEYKNNLKKLNACKFAGRPPGREDEIIRYRPN
jgi:hypothetical protein